MKIPAEVFNSHIAVLGKTGAGKTFRLRGMIEMLLKRGDRVCILDPKGDHYGVKLSADGKHPGFPVVIFGGEYADVPINDRSGSTVGELVGTGNRPCVIDMSQMRIGERTRFFMEFAAAIFRHNRATLYLVIDEVHNFAPQGKVHDPDAGKMLHWANRLASEGRGKGLRIIMASQRPQKVHKDTLTCAETLIAMRVIHKLDRDQIKEWMDGAGQPDVSKRILAELATMKRGEAWVWSPEIGFLDRNTSAAITTYDSMAAPTGDGTKKLTGWADVNLDDVKAKLADVVKEAEANDPKLLRARIAELERAAKSTKPVTTAVDQSAIARAVAAREKELNAHWQGEVNRLSRDLKDRNSRLGKIEGLAHLNGQAVVEVKMPDPATRVATGPVAGAVVVKATATSSAPHPPVREAGDPSRSNVKIPRNLVRCLEAFLWYEMLGISEPTDEQLCYKLGYSPTSSTISVLLSALRKGGYVNERSITDDGRAQAEAPNPGTLDQFHQQIRSFLDGTARRVFDSAMAAHPTELTADEFCDQNNWSKTSSTLSVGLSALRRAGLMEKRGHRLTDAVFPPSLV